MKTLIIALLLPMSAMAQVFVATGASVFKTQPTGELVNDFTIKEIIVVNVSEHCATISGELTDRHLTYKADIDDSQPGVAISRFYTDENGNDVILRVIKSPINDTWTMHVAFTSGNIFMLSGNMTPSLKLMLK